jgi:CHAT domain-containing protein/tetratricopeptide (TPR) repeat protein
MKLKIVHLLIIFFSSSLYSQTADEYIDLAFEAFNAGNINNQILYAEKAISEYEKSGIFETYFIYANVIAAKGYVSQNNYVEALNCLGNARLKYSGGQSESLSLLCSELGNIYMDLGNYSLSEKMYLESLKILRNVTGTDNADYITTLGNLALLNLSMSNYSKAEAHYIEALRLCKKVLGIYNTNHSSILNGLAQVYRAKGDYPKAEAAYKEALVICATVSGQDNISYSAILNSLAIMYQNMGDFSKAEPIFLEALKINKKAVGTNHPEYAQSLNNLAGVYRLMGDYQKAEKLYSESMEIFRNIFGNDHPKYATCIENLAGLYRAIGNNSKAEQLYQTSLAIYKKSLGTNHTDYAISLNNLAVLYESTGEYSKAEPILIESMEINKRIYGSDKPEYALSLNNLAALYASMGIYSKAEQMYQESLDIYRKVSDNKNLNFAEALNNLASLYLTGGQHKKAYFLMQEAIIVIQQNIKNSFTVLSESDRSIFSKKFDHLYEILLSTFSFSPEQEKRSILKSLLFRKGLVLNSSVNTRSFILSSNDAALKLQYDEWISTKQVINNLYSKTIEQRKNSGYNLDSLEEYANTLEKELSRMSSTFNDFVMIPDFKWEDVRQNLKEDEAVVDLVKYKLYDKRWTDTTRYGVFITRYDSDEEPVYFEFKDGNRIDTLLIPKLSEQNRNRFADITPEAEDENVVVLNSNEELDYYTELFAPIAQHLNGIKRIYFSLDGEFYKVNFNTLKNPKTGKYLIEDYEIVYVSSANEIARGKRETIPHKSAVLTGFPNYDLSLDSLTATMKIEQGTEKSHDVYVNTSKIQKYTLDLLPGTKEEVTITSELLKKNGWEVDSWLFNEATESKIKGLNAPGILSISTHGFFSPSPKADYTENYFVGSETKKAMENPLLRSGLFLTGSETFLNSDETQKDNFAENGILTAYEASQLNLLGTDIVILSACETGLGEVNNGEGVFGLQRGFFGAGAKSVLMSLWKVDDTATRDLMIELIKNYSTTMNKQQSLRDAQLTIMKKYPQPYYWGAFVMVGL